MTVTLVILRSEATKDPLRDKGFLMKRKQGFIHILANKYNTVFYVGVTADLIKRIWEHKNNLIKGFSEKYNVHKLVYYEVYETIEEAIKREKYIKGKGRAFKKNLIEKMNPGYKDLYDEIL